MGQIPLPKGYQRLGAFPIDDTSLFGSLAMLQDYALNNPSAYAGQVCSVNDTAIVTVYKINPDKSVTVLSTADEIKDLDFGLFN